MKRKTSSKKFRASIKRLGEWLRKNRILPLRELMEKIKQKLLGYYRYYGITDNVQNLDKFSNVVRRLAFKWLNRRSQRRSYTWTSFDVMFKHFNIPKAKLYVNIFELKEDITYIL